MHYPLGSRQIYSFVATTTKLMYGNIVHVLDNCHHLPSLNVIVARIIVMIQTVVIITMKSMKMVTTTKTSNWGFTKANNLQKIEDRKSKKKIEIPIPRLAPVIQTTWRNMRITDLKREIKRKETSFWYWYEKMGYFIFNLVALRTALGRQSKIPCSTRL